MSGSICTFSFTFFIRKPSKVKKKKCAYVLFFFLSWGWIYYYELWSPFNLFGSFNQSHGVEIILHMGWVGGMFPIEWQSLSLSLFKYLLIYFWLRWVSLAARGIFHCLACSSLALALWLWSLGFDAPQHVRSCFPSQGSNGVPCTGRGILDCWTTREVPGWQSYCALFDYVLSLQRNS